MFALTRPEVFVAHKKFPVATYSISMAFQILADQIERYVDTDQSFDLFPFLRRCALDIICGVSMSQEQRSNGRSAGQSQAKTLFYLVQTRPFFDTKLYAKFCGTVC
jgi:hypothetical protein